MTTSKWFLKKKNRFQHEHNNIVMETKETLIKIKFVVSNKGKTSKLNVVMNVRKLALTLLFTNFLLL
jgi:hypothetical protein